MSPPRYDTWKIRSSGSSATSRQTTQPTPSGRQAELVARRADRLHPRQPEVPLDVRRAERGEERAARAVDVDVDVEPGLGLQRVERVGERLHQLVGAGVGDAERRHDHDRVLVDAGEHVVDVHRVVARRHRHLAHLDVPVLGELVPHHLHRPAHHVRPVGRLARRRALRPPAPLGRHPARACTPRTSRSPTRRRCWPTRARSTGRRACARSAARSRRSAGTRPCRSCSCRSPGPSAGGPPAPPTSGRTSPGSGGSCRRASARRRRRRRRPRSATRRSGSGTSAPPWPCRGWRTRNRRATNGRTHERARISRLPAHRAVRQPLEPDEVHDDGPAPPRDRGCGCVRPAMLITGRSVSGRTTSASYFLT